MAGNGHSAPGRRLFTLPELAEMSSIDYRTLHNWQKRGMLSASHHQARGSGKPSLFDEIDAVQVMILAELRRAGVEVRALERISRSLRELVANKGGADFLLIAKDAVLLRDLSELEAQLSGEGPSVVLNISHARHTVGRARAA